MRANMAVALQLPSSPALCRHIWRRRALRAGSVVGNSVWWQKREMLLLLVLRWGSNFLNDYLAELSTCNFGVYLLFFTSQCKAVIVNVRTLLLSMYTVFCLVEALGTLHRTYNMHFNHPFFYFFLPHPVNHTGSHLRMKDFDKYETSTTDHSKTQSDEN